MSCSMLPRVFQVMFIIKQLEAANKRSDYASSNDKYVGSSVVRHFYAEKLWSAYTALDRAT